MRKSKVEMLIDIKDKETNTHGISRNVDKLDIVLPGMSGGRIERR